MTSRIQCTHPVNPCFLSLLPGDGVHYYPRVTYRAETAHYADIQTTRPLWGMALEGERVSVGGAGRRMTMALEGDLLRIVCRTDAGEVVFAGDFHKADVAEMVDALGTR